MAPDCGARRGEPVDPPKGSDCDDVGEPGPSKSANGCVADIGGWGTLTVAGRTCSGAASRGGHGADTEGCGVQAFGAAIGGSRRSAKGSGREGLPPSSGI